MPNVSLIFINSNIKYFIIFSSDNQSNVYTQHRIYEGGGKHFTRLL